MRTVLIHLAAAVALAAPKTRFETFLRVGGRQRHGGEFKKRVVVPYGVGDACVGGTDCKACSASAAPSSRPTTPRRSWSTPNAKQKSASRSPTRRPWSGSVSSAGAVGALTSAKVCGGKLYVAAAADVKTDDGSGSGLRHGQDGAWDDVASCTRRSSRR